MIKINQNSESYDKESDFKEAVKTLLKEMRLKNKLFNLPEL